MQDNDVLDDDELQQPKKNKSSKKENNTDIHKGSWLKSVVKNGKWYLLGSFATKGMLFFLLPIYTRYMTTEEYGIFNTLNTLAQVLPILFSFALDSAFGRFFHDFKKDKEKLRTLFSTVYWFVAVYGLLTLIIIIFSSQWWLEDAAEVPFHPYAYLTFFPPLFMQLGMFGIVYLRQSLMSKMTSIVETLSTLANILVTLPLLVIWDLDIIARLWGNIAASFFIFIVMTVYFVRKKILIFRFDRQILRMSLLFSIPLVPSVASKWINLLSDRLIIGQITNMGDVGLYSLAANIAMILFLINISISQVIRPVTISGLVYDKQRTLLKMADFSLIMWVVMILANFGAFLFAKDVVMVFADKSYEGSYVFIPVLGFAYVLGAQTGFFNSILQYHKKTGIISVATISSSIINVILNFALIPIFGAIAAPFATIGSTITLLIIIGFASQRMDKIQIYWKETIFIGLVYALVTVVGFLFLFNAEVTWFNFFLKVLLFIATSLVVIWISKFQKPIIEYLRQNTPLKI